MGGSVGEDQEEEEEEEERERERRRRIFYGSKQSVPSLERAVCIALRHATGDWS